MDAFKIPLTNINKFALCSKEDFDELNKKKWYLCGNYIKMTNADIRMHRYVFKDLMGNILTKGSVVDHINRDTLDNRRENLRLITTSQNSQNKSKITNSSSKYYGVSLVKKTQKYRSHITVNNKAISLGTYATELEAAKVYDLYLAHHPERGKKMELCYPMNFPENLNAYLKIEPLRIKEKTSKYEGVRRSKDSKFNAEIIHNGKLKSILRAQTELECAKAYDKYIIDHNLKKKLNFPDPKLVLTQGEKIDDNTIRLVLTNMPNKVALIDKEDYEKLKQYKITGKLSGVSVKINGVLKLIHRVIMKVDDHDVYIDHINNDNFDNRKINLRLSNAKLNSQNKKKQENTTSRFLGVSKKKITSKGIYWQSHVKNGNTRFAACDYNEETVARKRDLYIIKNMAFSHMKLNFIWTNEEIENWSNKLQI